MKFRLFTILIFLLVIYNVSGKRYSGGSRRTKPSSYSRPASRPASTSQNNSGKKASSDFLLSESGRPSRPAPSQSQPPVRNSQPSYSPPHSSGSHAPSAPSYPTHNKPVQDHHQQSSAPVSHSDPYSRQPAQNPNAPYVPSGGYGHSPSNVPPAPHGISVPSYSSPSHGSAPYPSHLPNHPHPDTSLGSSHYPSSHSSPQLHPQQYPNTHSSYPSHGPPPAYGSAGAYPPNYSHQAPPPYHAPSYQAPAAPAYQPATAPFVPGRTVYVVSDGNRKSSSGPGIGSIIAGGVAGGVAAGATNAIVDHAISSIFRPSSNHVHTYPSPPPVGTPTSSVTTNNYYYGSAGPTDGANNNNNNGNNGNANVAPQMNPGNAPASQPGGYSPPVQNQPDQPQNMGPMQNNPAPQGAPAGAQGNPVLRTGLGDPSAASNGVVTNYQETPPPPVDSGFISDENLMRLTEELFENQEKNLNQLVELNLQKQVAPNNQGAIPDEAAEPLFKLKPELDTIPTVATLRALYDNYQRDGTQNEVMSPERRSEENAFLDEVVKTPVMKRALGWLTEQKFVEADETEQKDHLKRMWFSTFQNTSSGFERIFLSEKFGDGGIVGMQNWLYFAHLEGQKNVDYLGFVDKLNLNDKGLLLKLNYRTEGFTMQNATIFVGTSPELELALYTVCFHARQNNWCPISLGGSKFFMLTHSFRSYGKDIIDLAFPAF